MLTRLTVPTPFQVGAVCAYLAGRTLIDLSPDSEEAWSHLLEALEERGLTPTDIERCGMARSTAETVTELPEVFLRYAPDVATDKETLSGDTLVVQDTVLDVGEVLGHAGRRDSGTVREPPRHRVFRRDERSCRSSRHPRGQRFGDGP